MNCFEASGGGGLGWIYASKMLRWKTRSTFQRRNKYMGEHIGTAYILREEGVAVIHEIVAHGMGLHVALDGYEGHEFRPSVAPIDSS